MKKKLSILTYSLSNGGAEKVVSLLVNEWKNKFEITLFLMNNTIFYDLPPNVNIVQLDTSKVNESGLKKFFKLPLLALKYKQLNKSNVSLSFMNRPNYINILAKLFGMNSKVIISERAMPSLQHKDGIQGKINRILIKLLYPKADYIIANSKGNSFDLKEKFNCINIKTISNPIDLVSLSQQSQEKVEFRDSKFTFITIGRIDSGKNHRLLIEAIRYLDAKLFIIGDGILKRDLEKYVQTQQMEDKIVFLGLQKNPYKFLSQADCFVFSSLYEGFPNVLLEALACKLPLIATDCKSGPREIIAPNTLITKGDIQDGICLLEEYGILIKNNSALGMTRAMQMIIDNQQLRNEYSNKASQRVVDFDIKIISSKFEEVICVE